MANHKRVIVAGSINMDIVALADRHPVPGETVAGSDLNYFPGGKGANQAVAAARGGADVSMIGAIGDDAFGPDLLQFLQSTGVDTEAVRQVPDTPTGTALIVVAADGQNAIVVVPGANAAVNNELVASVEPSAGDVLLAQFETPLESTIRFFELGAANGATCILNPAPAADVPSKLLRLTDILVLNESELASVSRTDLSENSSLDQLSRAYESVAQNGFGGSLIATLGARGSVSFINGQPVETAGQKVDAVDTTGAGDCFVGSVAAQLSLGVALESAISYANAAAALCVQRSGAGPSMPDKDEVEKAMTTG